MSRAVLITMGPLFSDSAPHRYAWSGLRIHSSLPLPELLETRQQAPTPDVQISGRYAKVGIELDAMRSESWLDARSDRVEFHLQGVATFLVRNDRISIIAHPSARLATLQSLVYGTALGALAHLLGRIALHASAITHDGGAYLFVGPAGSGKSSLAASMSALGANTIADDPCVVWLQGDQVVTAPCRTPRWSGSPIAPFMPKSAARPLHDAQHVPKSPIPVRQIFVLAGHHGTELATPHPIGCADAVAGLARNVFRPMIVDRLRRRAYTFQRAAKISERLSISRLALPAQASQQPAFARSLLHGLQKARVEGVPHPERSVPAMSRAS